MSQKARKVMNEKDLNYYLSLPYPIVLRREDEVWAAEIPDLPGCIAAGETREEALTMIDDAKEAWLSVSLEAGDPIPEPERQPA